MDLKKIRTAPEHTRRRILYVLLVVSGIALVVLWVMNLTHQSWGDPRSLFVWVDNLRTEVPGFGAINDEFEEGDVAKEDVIGETPVEFATTTFAISKERGATSTPQTSATSTTRDRGEMVEDLDGL